MENNDTAQFIALCFQEKLFDYLHLIMDIGRYTDPDAILQKILEVQQMQPQIRDETLAYADEFFRQRPEFMWKMSTFQEAAQRMEQQGVQQGVQQTLIRQLRRKFTSIPESIVQKIEATSDIEQLDTWLAQIIVANSLADTGLLNAESKQSSEMK